VVSRSRQALIEELVRYNRLLEVGIGNRPGVARGLAERGHDVVAIDVSVGERTRAAASGSDEPTGSGSLRAVEGDVLALSERADGEAASANWSTAAEFDAVYACNLPAELQRPTVALAERLDVACLFTTLGFEEPTVPVRRRSLPGTTVYVAREGSTAHDSAGTDPSR
jgi:uncharacterized UPF0146 family protein